MTQMHLQTAVAHSTRRAVMGVIVMFSIISTGCATNYLTNSTEGTYGVPVTERTIPQRLLDRSIEHTAKVNIYGLQDNLQQNSRIGIDSFNSEVLLTGEVPTDAIKAEIEKVVSSMPDVRHVYNELTVSIARGYSSTVQDGYITSKLMAKVAANNNLKTSQIKVVTNDGLVYIMGRMTPTQQSNFIDIANSTAGVTELVLLTTLVDDTGAKISDADIMSENNLANKASADPVANDAPNGDRQSIAVVEGTDNINPSPIENSALTNQPSSSPYIDLYKDQ